ncbi:MAG: ABC-2 transporter permease [Hominimerdicola sp.]
MKGLLKKDFYMLKGQLIAYLILLVMFSMILNEFILSIFLFLVALFPMTAFSFDDRSKYTNLLKMMPYKSFDIVFCKYLEAYIVLGLTTIVELLINLVLTTYVEFFREHFYVFSDTLKIIPFMIMISLIFMAIFQPLMFLFGEKGRAVIPAICGGFIGFFMTILCDSIPVFTEILIETSYVKPALIGAVIAVLLNVLSVLISYKIYIKKKG